MDLPTDALFTEAMKLSPIEREDLAVRLLGSVDKDRVDGALDPEWDAEIARRVKDIESGKAELIPSETVFREMRERREQTGG